MNNKYEIILIILLVLTILAIHTVPLIIEKDVLNTRNLLSFDNNKPLFPPKVSLGSKSGNKYTNVFEPQFDLSDFKFEKGCHSKVIRSGENCRVSESKEFSDYIDSLLDIPWDHTIHYVEAEKGHRIKKGKMELTSNIDEKLKEVKSIWYVFPKLDLSFKDGWFFRDVANNTYHAPEDNSIIEFTKDDVYEMLELKSTTKKYFVIILNF